MLSPSGMDWLNCELIMALVIEYIFLHHNNTIVILLAGGTKSSQDKDIQKAKNIARLLQQDEE